jgi:hypothetical protein
MVCIPLIPSFDIRLTSHAGYLGSSPKPSTISSLVLLASPPTRRLRRPCRPIPFPFCTIPSLAARRPLRTPSSSTLASSLLLDVPTSRALTSMPPSPAFCLAHTTKTVSWTTLYSSVRIVEFSRRLGTPVHPRSSRTPTTTGRSPSTRTGFTPPRSATHHNIQLLLPHSFLGAKSPLPSVRLVLSGVRRAAVPAPATAASLVKYAGRPSRATGPSSGTARIPAPAQAVSVAASRSRLLASSTIWIEAVARRRARSRSNSDHQGARRSPVYVSPTCARDRCRDLPCLWGQVSLSPPLLFASSLARFLSHAPLCPCIYHLLAHSKPHIQSWCLGWPTMFATVSPQRIRTGICALPTYDAGQCVLSQQLRLSREHELEARRQNQAPSGLSADSGQGIRISSFPDGASSRPPHPPQVDISRRM